MDKPKHTLETHRRIYNDKTGDFLSISPDSDGLDLTEIAHGDGSTGKLGDARIIVTDEELPLLIEALTHIQAEKAGDNGQASDAS